jgi:hypothetical protein
MARMALMENVAITAAGTYTTDWVRDVGAEDLVVQANFDYGSGGTAVKAYVQTSLDGGQTATDVMCFAFATSDARRVLSVDADAAVATPATPTDGSLADNTVANGIIGDMLRVKYVVTGTYVASLLDMHASTQE